MDIENVSSKVEDSFVMCGNANWDYYFTLVDEKIESETISNIVLDEIESADDFENFIQNNSVIDYSFENNQYKVLSYAKN
ncbi:MAG: hypothetical protein QM490_04390 [Candidatus Gracilibacteria bacterium]